MERRVCSFELLRCPVATAIPDAAQLPSLVVGLSCQCREPPLPQPSTVNQDALKLTAEYMRMFVHGMSSVWETGATGATGACANVLCSKPLLSNHFTPLLQLTSTEAVFRASVLAAADDEFELTPEHLEKVLPQLVCWGCLNPLCYRAPQPPPHSQLLDF